MEHAGSSGECPIGDSQANAPAVAPRAKIWKPVWEGPIEGMVVNMINKNMWRFTPLFDFDDVFQDCYMLFLTCVHHYPQVIDPPHFTALMRTCIFNHFHVLSTQRSAAVAGSVASDDKTSVIDSAEARPENGEEQFNEVLEAAPDPIKRLILGLDRKGRPRRHRRLPGGRREGTNEFLCRIARLDPKKIDLQTMLNTLTAQA